MKRKNFCEQIFAIVFVVVVQFCVISDIYVDGRLCEQHGDRNDDDDDVDYIKSFLAIHFYAQHDLMWKQVVAFSLSSPHLSGRREVGVCM